ncbi:MAG: hypothetical protein ACWGNV_11175 [Bacteroidales bacterium]
MPKKIPRLWRELQRRNVVRVVSVYAASSFVIMLLVHIITGPFGLPDWTLKFVIAILAVGLFVAVAFSWLYDIHPEEGTSGTEPEEKDG